VRIFALVVAAMTAVVSPAFADSSSKAIRLMTYNLNYGNWNTKATLDAIAKADVDVVLLQEITDDWKQLLETRFKDQYAHQAYRIHTRSAGGLAVLSKLPIKSEDYFTGPQGSWFPAGRLVVEATFGALQILNVHLRPAVESGNWIKGFMSTPPIRKREIESYWKQLASDMPTIIAGDFNEDPTGLAVGFLEGQGLARCTTSGPTTWHYVDPSHKGDLLKMDIDHVMTDKRLSTSDGHVLDVGGSDHRPVIVTIKPTS
jgi:endonuclease/exonuclease/phosphatase family metal-dependent hydrolase